MSNILYLGQSIIHEDADLGPIPAIYLGIDTAKKPIILTKSYDTTTKKATDKITRWALNDQLKSCDFSKTVDNKSPTGETIRYGGLCKKIVLDVLLKQPPDDSVLAELNETEKHLTLVNA